MYWSASRRVLYSTLTASGKRIEYGIVLPDSPGQVTAAGNGRSVLVLNAEGLWVLDLSTGSEELLVRRPCDIGVVGRS